jgi:replicative DNA helicase
MPGDSVFDRVPPHDTNAEEAVLGGMLLSKDAIGEVTEQMDGSDFYDPRNETIYNRITAMFAAGMPVDTVLVANNLRQHQELDSVGGPDYLNHLISTVPTAANAVYYATIVHQKALLRSVIRTGTKITQIGYESGDESAEDVVNMAQSEAYKLGETKVNQDYEPIQKIAQETLKQIDDIQNNRISQGISTGFQQIDELTNGLQPGQLIIVAGRPAMGKSTLGMDFARSAAFRQHITTIVFSLEMSKSEIAQRVLSAQTGIPLTALRDAHGLNAQDWDRLNNTIDQFKDVPLLLDDSPNMSLMEIRAKCRRLRQTQGSNGEEMHRGPLGLVIIDYLQLMSSTAPVESRQQEVSEFSRALKLLAKEIQVPVVALSQLNRGPEMRQDKKPMLSDLRESGSIEQDADEVFLVHRPEFYDPDDRPGEADIILAKNRNGKTGTVTLGFEGAYSRFTNLATDSEQGV